MLHVIKILPEYFEAVASGEKTFEVRLDDRGFDAGDQLELCEWNGEYTGRKINVGVTYILRDSTVLKEGYVVLAIFRMGDSYFDKSWGRYKSL